MRIPRLVAPFAFLLLLLASAEQLHAQAGPEFRGVFVRDVAAGDDMEAVIEQSLPKIKSTLGRIFKGKARERLREVNRPYGWIRFTPQGSIVTVETDHWHGQQWQLATPSNGSLEKWQRRAPDGKVETVKVTTDTRGATMTQRFEAEDGARTNVYSLSPDGNTLTMNVTVISGKLTGPITYKLVYRRRQ